MTTAPKSTGFDPVRLIQRHQAGVWRYLRALGCDRAEADDLTQETFLAVLQKPFDDFNPAATSAYLRKVAHNLFITVRRRAGRVVPVEDIDQVSSLWSQWADRDNGESVLEMLRECMSELTQRARWALEMRFRDRLPRVEIAAALKITEHGAKNLMQRAKKQLRGCIERKMRQ
jgi:RNA polymerase sigma-70 factor (ECF subfamily)